MAQTVWLDNFKLVAEPADEQAEADPVVINDYSLPLCGVAFIGGDSIAVSAEENDAGDNETKVDYSVPAGTIAALIHQIPEKLPADTKKLSLRIKSEAGVTLLMNMEEQTGPGDGNKRTYNQTIVVPASADWQVFTLSIEDFNLQGDHIDPNGRLDPDQVRMIMIVDIRPITEQQDFEGTLYLGELAATR